MEIFHDLLYSVCVTKFHQSMKNSIKPFLGNHNGKNWKTRTEFLAFSQKFPSRYLPNKKAKTLLTHSKVYFTADS